MSRVKADYKHQMTVKSAGPKRFAPNLFRFVFFTGLTLAMSFAWYSQQTKKRVKLNPTVTQIQNDSLPETVYTPPSALERSIELVALAPLESLPPHTSQEREEALAPEAVAMTPIREEHIWQQFYIAPGENLSFHLNKYGLSSSDIYHLMNVAHKKQLSTVFPGQMVRVQVDPQKQFRALELALSPTQSVRVRQVNGRYASELIEKTIEKRIMVEGTTIQDSLFLAGKRAKLSDNMIMEMANIFAYDIDFALDIRPEDNFKVIFEEHFVEGEKIDNGPILAAEFVNQGKRYTAIRFKDDRGRYSYFTPEGKSLKKAFIRTPVEYTRISSHFNLKRRHPVLHHIRAHKGVDYAAPIGTPVKAAGNGKVDFIGKKGGYGNVIVLQHGTKYSTLYAHLHRFHAKLRKGQTVKQGQTIGYVGKSGLATGPHLHYEFRINNVHHNPLTVALPQADPLKHQAKQNFLALAKEYQHLLKLQENIMLAKNDDKHKLN